jgi:hypothetical protein
VNKRQQQIIEHERKELVANIIWCVKFVGLLALCAAVVRLVMLVSGYQP